jgi:nicotinamide mononucleotide (NMN) deamidase PncC
MSPVLRFSNSVVLQLPAFMAGVFRLSFAVGIRQTGALGPEGGNKQQQVETVIFCWDNKHRESERQIRHFLEVSAPLGEPKKSFFRSALRSGLEWAFAVM